MIDLRSTVSGFALGTIPGLAGFVAAVVLWTSGTGLLTILEVVVMPFVFAAIGGILGALVNILFSSIRSRREHPTAASKRSASATGFAAGMVPGLNGMIFTVLFLQCWNTEPGSLMRLDCQGLRTFYLVVFASVAAAGGSFGALAGGILATRRNRRSPV